MKFVNAFSSRSLQQAFSSFLFIEETAGFPPFKETFILKKISYDKKSLVIFKSSLALDNWYDCFFLGGLLVL